MNSPGFPVERTNWWILFLKWWYGDGADNAWQFLFSFVLKLLNYFSFWMLLRTFFAPWKKDIIQTKDLSFVKKFHAWRMNVVARFIGVVVRTFTILFGIIFILPVQILVIIFFLAYLVAPVAAIGGLIYSLIARI